MVFSLSSFTYLVAEKDMPCDAFTVYLDVCKSLDIKQKQVGISTWFKARHGIKTGESYLEYRFNVIDEETGEVEEQVLSVLPEMNKLMVANEFYPRSILQAFSNYKSMSYERF